MGGAAAPRAVLTHGVPTRTELIGRQVDNERSTTGRLGERQGRSTSASTSSSSSGKARLSLDLPPTVTQFEIPPSLTAVGGLFKFEVIARTRSGNNSAVESCFESCRQRLDAAVALPVPSDLYAFLGSGVALVSISVNRSPQPMTLDKGTIENIRAVSRLA
jgi:hypothetical protein